MKQFSNQKEYQTAKNMLAKYDEARKAYSKKHKTNGIPNEVCKTFPFADQVNNDLRSAIETFEFINDKPDKYFLYINEKNKTATTWTGQQLGTVIFGDEYEDNFGGKRVSVRIKAINGLSYYGTYFKSAGNYARIKAIKN